MLELNSETFSTEVKNHPGLVLVDFWAPWCVPCKNLGPVIEELATNNAGVIKVAKVNIDENPQISSLLGIMSIPTVILFNNGQALKTLVGVQSKETYQSLIEKALANPDSVQSQVFDPNSPTPIIFSTNTCPWCHRLKEYLKEHQIEFKDVNVGEDAEAAEQMINHSGQTGVPQMWLRGEVLVGFDQSKIDSLLNIR